MPTYLFIMSLVLFLTCRDVSSAKLRPLFILKHLANSRDFVEKAINNGANGIEVDLRFTGSGAPYKFVHGVSCNCGVNKECWCRSSYECAQEERNVPMFLQYFRNISSPGSMYYHPSFTGFVWLDLKITSESRSYLSSGGKGLADILIDDVFNEEGKDSRAVFGLELYKMGRAYFIEALADQLRKRKREDILKNRIIAISTAGFVEEYLQKYGDLTPPIWLTAGENDCNAHHVPEGLSRKMVAFRENPNMPQVKKAAQWVLDSKTRIREALRYGQDVIMTNFPERVVEVMKEPEFYPVYRLATTLDPASEKV